MYYLIEEGTKTLHKVTYYSPGELKTEATCGRHYMNFRVLYCENDAEYERIHADLELIRANREEKQHIFLVGEETKENLLARAPFHVCKSCSRA